MKGRLLVLSSAAVLAVYTAGYARTRSAAELLDAEERRPPMPRPGSQDRTAIPPAPQEVTLVPASAVAPAGASTPDAAPPVARSASQESAVAPRPTVDAPAEKRAAQSVADRAANAASPSIAPAGAVAARSASEGSSAPAASTPVSPAAAPQIAALTPAPAVPAAPVAPLAPAVAPPAPAAQELPAAPAPAVPAAPKWKDGRYTGWGTSRHGDLQATVFIENGRIATASISQCLTRYPCDWIVKLPPQVVQRQSAEVDYVSGATESATAFYYAVLQALGKAAQ